MAANRRWRWPDFTTTRTRTALLFVLMAVPAMLEAGFLRATSFDPAVTLAAQAGVPGPVGTFHALRWVMVYHDSALSFALLLVAAVVFSGLLTAVAVWAAWPSEPLPRVAPLIRRNLLFAAVSAVLLSPWAVIAMAASETSLSWFILGELIPFAVIAVALARGPIAAAWWHQAPGLATSGWALALLLSATVGGMVVAFTPGWWVVPVAGAMCAANALIWLRLVRAAVQPVGKLSRAPVAAALVVLIFGALALSGMAANFGSASSGDIRADLRAFHVRSVAVVYVGGYDSSFSGPPLDGFSLQPFSYRGLDPQGKPLSYSLHDTHQSVDSSAQLLARQVSVAHARSGLPVAVVGISEGTVVLRDYLDTLPHPAVTAAVLMSPLVRPGRIYYPPPHVTGWGVAAGWELRGLLWLVRLTSTSGISPDEPFVRSILDQAPFYRDRMLCPVPGVRMVAFLPSADAAVVPPGLPPDIPVVEVPGVHASIGDRTDIQAQMNAFLDGAVPIDSGSETAYAVIQKAAAAWQAPALAIRVNPVWPQSAPDTSFGDNGCTYRGG